jgi:hypothetical protein
LKVPFDLRLEIKGVLPQEVYLLAASKQPGLAVALCGREEGTTRFGKKVTSAGAILASLPVSCATAGIPVSTGSIVIPGYNPRRCPSADTE